MRIQVKRNLKVKKGILIVPIFKDQPKTLPKFFPKNVKDFLDQLKETKDFAGKEKETAETYIKTKDFTGKIVVFGLGERKKYRRGKAREIGAAIGRTIQASKIENVYMLMLDEMEKDAYEFIEGCLMSEYKIDTLKTGKKEKKKKDKAFSIITGKNFTDDVKKAQTVVDGLSYTKDLVNMPANIVNSNYFAKEARKMARENGYKVAVFGDKELKKMKWGLLLAVNQGSANEAKCVVLEYNGGKKNEKPIVIVGKGVLFDSGGYNLKPTRYIETMHQDMAGGGTVMGVFKVLKKLGIKKNVVGIVPLAENMIDNKAYRPSDIITSYSGKTIEITNTDAEGRLVLADGITYGVGFKPKMILTIATLTGAVSTALGNKYAGLVGNDRRIRRGLEKAGRIADDRGWPLPLPYEYKKRLDSKIADIRNHDLGREAGCSLGAAFLERFIDGNKWCHIDIGGTAFTEKPKGYQQPGATGHGYKMLLNFLERA
jgi:leucyl aminopeptidase